VEQVLEKKKNNVHKNRSRTQSLPTEGEPLHPMLQLQQEAGNQAVQNLLRSRLIQAKLISKPSDPEEREADRVAENIMRAPADSSARPSCSCMQSGGEPCEECKQKQAMIQRRAAGGESPAAMPKIIRNVLSSPGRPLDAAARAFFETRFGTDFTRVRLHTGEEAAASARSIGALAYTIGNDIVFGAGQFSTQTSAGRSLLAHELAHTLQHGPGTVRRQDDTPGMTDPRGASAVAPPEPNISVATPEQYRARAAVDKALASKDPDDVHEISDFSLASEDERFKLARIVLDQRWVGPFDEYALERLWASFGDNVVSIASTDKGFELWKECLDRGAELDEAAPIQRLKKAFVADVTNVEVHYLSINRDFVVTQFEQMGLPISPTEQMPEPTMIQQEETRVLQQASGTLAELQKAQELSRTIVVGYEPNPVAQLARESQSSDYRGSPALQQPDYIPAFFNPYSPPTYDRDPSILSAVVRTSKTGVTPYSEVKAKYDEASNQIASILTAWPQLYAISRENDSAQTSAFARTENVAQARSQLAAAMRLLIGDIEQAVAKLGDEIDPLDLIPIHQQLLAGMASPSGVRWESKLPSFIAKQMQADHDFYKVLRDLGLQTASAALFMFAPFTGGASIFLALAGLGVAGLKYHLSAQEYEGLSLAGKTSPVPGTESVLPGQVERAKIIHDGDAVALALAALAVVGQAVSVLAAFRAVPAATTSLVPSASAMESELATTTVVGRSFTKGPLTITMAADGQSATIVHAEYPNAMIMANADGLTFYEMLPGGSRIVGQQPWVTVRGVTTPIAGSLPPGPGISTPPLASGGADAPLALSPVPTVPGLPPGPLAPLPLASASPPTLPQVLATPATVGPADIAAMRALYNVPANLDTLAVARTDIPELAGLTFQGASREVRALANIPSPPPYYVAPVTHARAQEHAEQDIVNAFRDAVTQRRLTSSQVKGALRIHISESTGVCTNCRQRADSPTGPGVLTQLSLDYRDLTIRVTWIEEDAKLHGFIMVDGHINLRF
jgi:hypothetical protein